MELSQLLIRLPWLLSKPLQVLTFSLVLALISISASGLIQSAHATSVRAVDFDQLIMASSFVFEGQVDKVESVLDEQAGVIRTLVRFTVIDVIKGELKTDSIELAFLGGTIDKRRMHIAEMHVPKIHERGIYFVESLTRRQVHPLLGWSQGHFVTQQDSAGTARIHSWNLRPITGVATSSTTVPGFSRGIARGLSVQQRGRGHEAMSASDFKHAIRTRLMQAGE